MSRTSQSHARAETAIHIAFAIIGSIARAVINAPAIATRIGIPPRGAGGDAKTSTPAITPNQHVVVTAFDHATTLARVTAPPARLPSPRRFVPSANSVGQMPVVLTTLSFTTVGMLASSCKVTQYRAHDRHRYASVPLRGSTIA